MKTGFICFGLFLLVSVVPVMGQVSVPEVRQRLLAQAERLKAEPVKKGEMVQVPIDWAPFHWPVEEIPEPVVPSGMEEEVELSDGVILAEISNLIKPGGILTHGSETLLIINDRRVPVGRFLNINYNGRKYKVQIVKADARNFVLRLNDETISKRIR